MAFAYVIDKEKKLVSFVAEGEVGVEALIAELEKVLGDPDFEQGMDGYIDASRMVPAPSVNPEKMKALGAFIKSYEAAVGECRWAFWTPSFIQHTFILMFKHMVRSRTVEMRLFKDEAEAKAWLES
ncbi:MAG: hypothetical protein ACYC4M_04745 [Thermoleophilia bacterium]